MMTRPVQTMDMGTFKKVVDQLQPWTEEQWDDWTQFVAHNYDIHYGDRSENHFYLHVIPRVVQLHGYGAPLLDKHMAERVGYLSAKRLPSYFSCNPANIDVRRFHQIMAAGLDYVKFSIESVSDKRHKEIRGEASNFESAFGKIMQLLGLVKQHHFNTTIVITMLDLGQEDQQEEYAKLREKFEGHDVYLYLKSQDQQWYDGSGHLTSSIHWSENCHHPWSSMTVKSDGAVAMCMEDYNNEIILGDAKTESLLDIWNGPAYDSFRKLHFQRGGGLKCEKQCDMNLVGTHFPWDGYW
jgi:MoaA/NifB/PqqE/SkfB family radical SAM enzyme